MLLLEKCENANLFHYCIFFFLLLEKLVATWFWAIYYMTTLVVEIAKFNLVMVDCGQPRVQKFVALC